MKTINLTIVIALLAVLSFNVCAQEEVEKNNTIVRSVQISFVTPLGTNGMESWNVSNNFSLNMIIGYSGGLKGFEIGGLYNMIKEDVKGLQIAGFGNTVMGNVIGCQISGFSNINKKNVKGLQIAGFSNTIIGNVIGCQISGFSNISKKNLNGIQIAGFSNIIADSATVSQISGFSNIVNGTMTGMQLTGFINIAKSMPIGTQISGFANINHGDIKGSQITGFANINSGNLKGVQISGFLNYTKKLTGAQIGFINICDTVEDGISLGFLSIVKKGYRSFELSGNESFYAVGSFKTGTEKFYNIISIGSRLESNFIKWGWGYGIGTMFPVTEKVKVNIDGIAYHINEDEWWTGRLNMLNKINLCASMHVSDNLTVFGGMTWNIQVSDINDREGNPVNSPIVSWSAYDKTIRNTNVKMYPGFTVGVRL